MKVFIRQESHEIRSEHRRFMHRIGPYAASGMVLSGAAVIPSYWLYKQGDRLSLASEIGIAVVFICVPIVGIVVWFRRRMWERRGLVQDALWVSELLGYVGPFGRDGVGPWAVWAELLPSNEMGLAFLALTSRSLELVPVKGMRETHSLPLDRVSSVDVVFGARRNRRGFSVRLSGGGSAHFVGKPDRALADHLRRLGADVVDTSSAVSDSERHRP